MAESLKLAGNNIPLESFVQRPLYSYNAATYKFCGSNLKTLMTLISINVTAKDKDGKIYGQYIYSSTVWDSVMTPCIEITFGDDWNRV